MKLLRVLLGSAFLLTLLSTLTSAQDLPCPCTLPVSAPVDCGDCGWQGGSEGTVCGGPRAMTFCSTSYSSCCGIPYSISWNTSDGPSGTEPCSKCDEGVGTKNISPSKPSINKNKPHALFEDDYLNARVMVPTCDDGYALPPVGG
jgi:hypothetical protein